MRTFLSQVSTFADTGEPMMPWKDRIGRKEVERVQEWKNDERDGCIDKD